MDQDLLVKSDRDIGAQVMEALSRVHIPVILCEWNYVPQLKEWQLIIATPWYDSKGPRTTYRALVDALERAGIYRDIPMRRVFIKSPNDPIVKTLIQEAKEQEQGSIHVLKHGTHFSLIFTPITREGSIPARRFSSVRDLERFLAQDLHLRPNLIETVVDEVEHSGAGSISQINLSTRQVKKLGLA
jgi:hypothetical protein